MRILLLSDIHSNLVALQAVLADARERGGWDVVWNLGDSVGYGPEPDACVELLTELGAHSVAGNHEGAVVERLPLDLFNPVAAAASRWTTEQMTPEHKDMLLALPEIRQQGSFTLCHGSPRDPMQEYLVRLPQAEANFALLSTDHAIVGHSHVPLAFQLPLDGVCRGAVLPPDQLLSLTEGRWILNPGSVGQPRDGDNRASYALLDDETMVFGAYRVPYDIAETQARMYAMALPEYLAERLSYGR